MSEFDDLKSETGDEELTVEDVKADLELVEEALGEGLTPSEPKPVKKKKKKKRKYELAPMTFEKPSRKRKDVYLVKYIGTAKTIRLSGIGKIYIGKEFEVSENVANALKLDENFEVRKSYTYVEV